MMYVPEGCAHGYLALEDSSEVMYWVTRPYAPQAERGVRWDDAVLGIAWPMRDGVILSPKDRAWPGLTPASAAVHRTQPA
jgi:dTDP-4-dehydrorhamnose 3,5-epimerase